MHTAEEVRKEAASFRPSKYDAPTYEMLLAYADLLEAMEDAERNNLPPRTIEWLRQRAAEKQKARNGK